MARNERRDKVGVELSILLEIDAFPQHLRISSYIDDTTAEQNVRARLLSLAQQARTAAWNDTPHDHIHTG